MTVTVFTALQVRYKADSVEMDLTELARSEHPLMKVTGEVIYDKCQELAESRPITFTTPQSYLTIPTWDKALDRGTLAFQFQTVEQNGLLMYSTGITAGNSDFFALEVVDGYLNLVLNQGSESIRIICRSQPVSDGKPHNVYFEYEGSRGYITVNGQKEVFASLSRLDRFDLDGSLSIGGVNKNVDSATLPRELWVGMLGNGYVGCLLEMVMDGNKIDLVTAAQIQGAAGVAQYCQVMEPHCLSQPCMHQGVCVEGWNRFTCDCRATGFIDSVCQTGEESGCLCAACQSVTCLSVCLCAACLCAACLSLLPVCLCATSLYTTCLCVTCYLSMYYLCLCATCLSVCATCLSVCAACLCVLPVCVLPVCLYATCPSVCNLSVCYVSVCLLPVYLSVSICQTGEEPVCPCATCLCVLSVCVLPVYICQTGEKPLHACLPVSLKHTNG